MLTRISNLLKKRPVKWGLEILVFLLVYLVARAWMQRDIITGPVPEVKGISLTAEKIDISSKHERPLLLHFWASWCGICRFEQGSIEAISLDHQVVTIAMQSGTDEEVRQFLKVNKLTFKVLNDEDGVISERFGITGVPATFIINSQGEIVYKEVGYSSEWGLRLRLWLSE